MGTNWSARMAVSAVLAAAVFVGCAPAVAQPLNREVQSLVNLDKLSTVSVGVSVIDVDTRETVASMNTGEAFMPASNLKLLTSGTALLVLGKDFEFKTRLVRDGDKLVVIGAGDPAFADPKLLTERKLPVDTFLDMLADAVRQANFTGIKEVVLDERVFDHNTIHPSWPRDQLNKWYCAPVQGLNFYTNVLEIFPTRGDRVGAPPYLRTSPSAKWIEITNQARTVDNDNTAVGALHGDGDFRFTFFGNLKQPPDEPVEITVKQPAMMFGKLLADRLGRLELGVNKATPTVRFAADDEKINAKDVLAVVSTRLTDVLKRCNTDSQNLYAESLCKRVGYEVTGQPGSWENGAAVIRMQLTQALGPNPGDLFISDGSGLSKDNRVTPGIMSGWLAAMARDSRNGPTFMESLASASEGKLEKRFKDKKLVGDVRAKTGYINNSMCLSGYVTNDQTGRRVAFSILVNGAKGAPLNTRDAKKFHEDVVAAVDKWLARQAPRAKKPVEQEGQPAMGG